MLVLNLVVPLAKNLRRMRTQRKRYFFSCWWGGVVHSQITSNIFNHGLNFFVRIFLEARLLEVIVSFDLCFSYLDSH